MPYLAAESRLRFAVERRLATGTGPIRERLMTAWVEIAMLGAAGVNVPPEVMREVNELKQNWAAAGQPGILNHAKTLSEENCVTEAERLVRWLHLVSAANASAKQA